MVSRLVFDLLVALVFLIMIMVLVIAHEYGHYLFAKLFGMGIEEFAVGYGKPILWVYRKKTTLLRITESDVDRLNAHSEADDDPAVVTGLKLASQLEGGGAKHKEEVVFQGKKPFVKQVTEFTIRAWPLGGFVRIKGMIPDEHTSEIHVPGGFYQKSAFQRFVVLLAGPVFSVLAGILLLVPYNMAIGEPKSDHSPVINGLAEGMPAMQAGIKIGDRIVAIDGKKISNFYQVLEAIKADKGNKVKISVERDGKELTFEVKPTMDKDPSPVMGPDLLPNGQFAIQPKIGAAWRIYSVPMPFPEAVIQAAELPWLTIKGLIGSLNHPAQLKQDVGGPETMIRMTADATSAGIFPVILLAGLLSVSLGIFNLLPFPPLDGGQMAIAVVEMCRRGQRLSLRVQGIVFTTGLAAVGLLVVSVLYIDFMNGRNVPQGVKIITSNQPQKPPQTH